MKIVAGIAVVLAWVIGVGAVYVSGRSSDSPRRSMRVLDATPRATERRSKSQDSRDAAEGWVGPQASTSASSEQRGTSNARTATPALREDPDRLAQQLAEEVRREPRDGIWSRQTESAIRESI